MRAPIAQLVETPIPRRTFKHRLRRIERVTLRHAHRFIVRRMANFRLGRRRAVSWVLLIGALVGLTLWQGGLSAQQYATPIPAEGGVYTEGVLGTLDNLNPILASSPAERSAARLLFADLVGRDANGDLVPALAQSWSGDEAGQVYTIRLRPDAKWQDGVPITADDVVFTFSLIKNADTRSPLYASWRNIAVEKIDATTVKFTLPSPYAAFLYSLGVGMLPYHVLKDVPASGLRTAHYNRAPTIVSGPFVFQGLRAMDATNTHYLLELAANKSYALGAPKLSGFHLNAYANQDDLAKAFRTQEVASFGNATADNLKSLGAMHYIQINTPLDDGTYAFLNNENTPLNDVHVRQALQYATDEQAILKMLGNRAQALGGPLLPGQLGYRSTTHQPKVDDAHAAQLLDQAGWGLAPNGKRQKNGQPLRLHLTTITDRDFPAVAQELMAEWSKIGIDFDSQLVRPEEAQQSVIVPRAYDVLIYEIAIGQDPDVYVYWSSSQANTQGFNLSNYKSGKVDDVLASARSRIDPALRDAKYHAFSQQWLNDAPAIALYRPAFTYVQNDSVLTFDARQFVDVTDRYFNITSWAAGHVTGRPTR